jgi:hypothetical protein
VICLLAGVQYQSRGESEVVSRVSREHRGASFTSRNYAGHACEQARQLIVIASKWALYYLTVMAGYLVRHTPAFIENQSPPKHDVTEGFMALDYPEAITLH